jgi:hypothetical protein
MTLEEAILAIDAAYLAGLKNETPQRSEPSGSCQSVPLSPSSARRSRGPQQVQLATTAVG